jgi:hypothetical protein
MWMIVGVAALIFGARGAFFKGTANVALPPKKEAQGKGLGGLKDKYGVLFLRDLSQRTFKGGALILLVIFGAIQYVARSIVKTLQMISHGKWIREPRRSCPAGGTRS